MGVGMRPIKPRLAPGVLHYVRPAGLAQEVWDRAVAELEREAPNLLWDGFTSGPPRDTTWIQQA